MEKAMAGSELKAMDVRLKRHHQQCPRRKKKKQEGKRTPKPL